jgi:hypothetical protein
MATITLTVGVGTQQWTPPIQCQVISTLELWGAAGSGARFNGRRATGGGSGAYNRITGPIAVAPLLVGGTVPYQTGAGGPAATVNGNGSNGTATWFSAAGTYFADFGRAGQTTNSGTAAGGIAGAAANCIPTTNAVTGGAGGTCSNATGASGGGASGSANGAGVTAAAVSTAVAGLGATAPSGGGSGGNASITAGSNAQTGTSPGGGGGGMNAAANSGAGAAGQIIITYSPLWPGISTVSALGTPSATARASLAGVAAVPTVSQLNTIPTSTIFIYSIFGGGSQSFTTVTGDVYRLDDQLNAFWTPFGGSEISLGTYDLIGFNTETMAYFANTTVYAQDVRDSTWHIFDPVTHTYSGVVAAPPQLGGIFTYVAGRATINGIATISFSGGVTGPWSSDFSSDFGPLSGGGIDPWSSDFSSDFGPLSSSDGISIIHPSGATQWPGTADIVGVMQPSFTARQIWLLPTTTIAVNAVVAANANPVIHQTSAGIGSTFTIVAIPGYAAINNPWTADFSQDFGPLTGGGTVDPWSVDFSQDFGPLTTTQGVFVIVNSLPISITEATTITQNPVILARGTATVVDTALVTSSVVLSLVGSTNIATTTSVVTNATHSPAGNSIVAGIGNMNASALWIDVDAGPEIVGGAVTVNAAASHTPAGATVFATTGSAALTFASVIDAGPERISGISALTVDATHSPAGLAAVASVSTATVNAIHTPSASTTIALATGVTTSEVVRLVGTASVPVAVTVSQPAALQLYAGPTTISNVGTLTATIVSTWDARATLHLDWLTNVEARYTFAMEWSASTIISDSTVVAATPTIIAPAVPSPVAARTTVSLDAVHAAFGTAAIAGVGNIAVDAILGGNASVTISTAGLLAVDAIHSPTASSGISISSSVGVTEVVDLIAVTSVAALTSISVNAVHASNASLTIPGTVTIQIDFSSSGSSTAAINGLSSLAIDSSHTPDGQAVLPSVVTSNAAETVSLLGAAAVAGTFGLVEADVVRAVGQCEIDNVFSLTPLATLIDTQITIVMTGEGTMEATFGTRAVNQVFIDAQVEVEPDGFIAQFFTSEIDGVSAMVANADYIIPAQPEFTYEYLGDFVIPWIFSNG